MKPRFILAAVITVLGGGIALAQINVDVLGAHNMSPASGTTITGNLGSPCLYCHAPHSGIEGTAGVQGTPLWSQKLSSVPSYQVYGSGTMVNKTNVSPPLGSNSTLCLSCHDGTVALGTLTPYGQVAMSASLANTPADLGTDLRTTHPFSFVTPLRTAPDLWPSLSANPPSTQDQTGAVQLINGNVECGSCHNPHVQNIDPNSPFLIIDNSQSALCLACHDTVPSGTGHGLTAVRATAVVSGNTSSSSAGVREKNPLALWSTSAHATAGNRIANTVIPAGFAQLPQVARRRASLGPYTTVRDNGCLSCHATHNSAANMLLRTPGDRDCLGCHSGGNNVSPPAPNVYAEMSSPKIPHTVNTASGNNPHSAQESELLNHNRHAECVDCHNPHATKQAGTVFPPPPLIRPAQSGVNGISATDGRTVVSPAVNQYENCLRCHGASTGKKTNRIVSGYLPNWATSVPDPLNVLAQMSQTAISKHPVMQDRGSPFPQPSLRQNMLALDGNRPGRSMGVRILCTDCHNSDDNREFGGTGASGPHGSKYPHILERRYDMNEAPLPGQPITKLNIPPDLSTTGNYALCAKCHDLANVISNASFIEHGRHIDDGFSCSVCHSAHGVGFRTGMISGERMVNFDTNVVGPNGRSPISYKKSTSSCNLTCHGHVHGGLPSLIGGPPVRVRP